MMILLVCIIPPGGQLHVEWWVAQRAILRPARGKNQNDWRDYWQGQHGSL